MRWSTGFNLFLLLRAWSTAAARLEEPLVYLYNPITQPSTDTIPRAVKPETARLIFADRLGLSQLYSLEDVDDANIEHLNAYGGVRRAYQVQPQLADKSSASKAIIILDGVQETPADLKNWQTFTLTETPSRQQNNDLFRQLDVEASGLSKSRSAGRQESSATRTLRLALPQLVDNGWCVSSDWGAVDEALFAHLNCSMSGDAAFRALQLFSSVASEYKIQLTVAIMPASPSNPSQADSMPYGPICDAQETVASNLRRRQETVLSEPAPSAKQTSTSAAPAASSSSSPFPFVAQCFATAADCEKGTGNCTGHGECVVRSHTAPNGEEEGGASDCFVCSCNKPEVVTNADGSKKTTYFGGSACQKKDVSVPFWILTLTTGSLVALVAFGVSVLYAMGNAELPSVIGAGVSGPRAK